MLGGEMDWAVPCSGDPEHHHQSATTLDLWLRTGIKPVVNAKARLIQSFRIRDPRAARLGLTTRLMQRAAAQYTLADGERNLLGVSPRQSSTH